VSTVLGLDPGTATTGYGLVQARGSQLHCIAYGTLNTPAKTPMPERLAMLFAELKTLITQYQPESAAVEQLFFYRNVTTAISVAQARGVVLLALQQAGLSIGEYTPLQVKQGVVGYGGADKKQVQQMVKVLLGLNEIPKPDDAADALAVAICHSHSRESYGGLV